MDEVPPYLHCKNLPKLTRLKAPAKPRHLTHYPQESLHAMIYVIIANWNGATDLAECVESLLHLATSEVTILICDNGSSDDSRSRLSSLCSGDRPAYHTPAWAMVPTGESHKLSALSDYYADEQLNGFNIRWVAIGDNIGFAAASNIGMKCAFVDHRAEYVWLLNNDTIVHPLALNMLISTAETSGAGLVGSTLLHYDRPDTIQAIGGYYNFYTAHGKEILNGCKYTDIAKNGNISSPITYPIGASMLVSRKFYEAVGPMSEKYFLYFEELDWCARATSIPIAWSKGSIVYHKGSSSTGGDEGPIGVYYKSRSRLVFFRTHYPARQWIPYVRSLLQALRFLIKGRTDLSNAVLESLSDVYSGRELTHFLRRKQTSGWE